MTDQQQSLFSTPPLISEENAAPYSRKSRTSIEAGKGVTRSGAHKTIKDRVLGVLKYRAVLGIDGATDEEIHGQIGGRLSSIVAARNSLCEQGLVEHSGKTRRSPTTGMPCAVWKIKP